MRLAGRVGVLGGQDVLLAQDRASPFDQEPGALVGVGDDAFADDDAFARLELDFMLGFLIVDRTSDPGERWLNIDVRVANSE